MARAREFGRLERVNASVKRVLAAPLDAAARAEAGALATITAVSVSPDLRHGTVWLSVYGGPADPDAVLRAIASRAAELQAEVATKLRLKRTPVLAFRLDDALARGDRIARLLRRPEPDAAG
jgi:ribosome-binding factor A